MADAVLRVAALCAGARRHRSDSPVGGAPWQIGERVKGKQDEHGEYDKRDHVAFAVSR
jgi:hypothetical protein